MIHSDRYPLSMPAHALFGIVALALTVLAYFPAVSGYLAFDDFANLRPFLTWDGSIGTLWEAVRNNQSGPTGRPVAMLTFAAQTALLGPDPWHFKLGNILIHLLAGTSLFLLCRSLLSNDRDAPPSSTSNPAFLVSTAVALIWLVHPFNLTAVAYTIQRMTSLSALFTTLALMAYIRTRLGPFSIPTYAKGGTTVLLFFLLGLFSKENAALLVLFVLAAEITVLRHAPGLSVEKVPLRARRLLTAAACIGGAALVLLLSDQRAGSFDNRPFTLVERLLTEGRVVAWYMRQTLWPELGTMSIYHDDWTLSASLVTPPITLLAILLLAATLLIGIVLRKRLPVIAFGLLFFIAGHVLESTIIPLELVFEHRNYLPSFGLILAVASSARLLAERAPRGRMVFASAALVVLSICLVLAHDRAQRWSDDTQARIKHLLRQDESMRAQIEAAQTYETMARNADSKERTTELLQAADARFQAAGALRPRSAEPLFGHLIFRASNDLPVQGREIIMKIETAVSRGPVSSTTLNGLHALTRCTVAGPCNELAPDLNGIFSAALSNPDLSNTYEVLILRDRATFQAELLKRADQAVETLVRATQIAPGDSNLYIELAYYAARAGNRPKALGYLDKAEEVSEPGARTITIRRLRRAIIDGTVKSSRTDPRKDE